MNQIIDETSIAGVINRMTVAEKALLITGGSLFRSRAFPELGIPSLLYCDSAAGVNLLQLAIDAASRRLARLRGGADPRDIDAGIGVGALIGSQDDFAILAEVLEKGIHAQDLSPVAQEVADELRESLPGGELPTAFPCGMALGATWSPNVTRAVGREAAAAGIDVLLGTPTINIHRDPLHGRLFEGFSEDPYLIQQLAPDLVAGVQSQGIAANIKHFAANNQETHRSTINEWIPIRALREIYLPGYESCIRRGGALTVMSAYNSINGVPAAHNRWLLTDVLRYEWGFEGFVISDWGAAYDQVEALSAGNDVDMPGPRPVRVILEAIEDGRLDEATLDAACERFLRVVCWLEHWLGRLQMTCGQNRPSARSATRPTTLAG